MQTPKGNLNIKKKKKNWLIFVKNTDKVCSFGIISCDMLSCKNCMIVIKKYEMSFFEQLKRFNNIQDCPKFSV